MNCSNDVCPGGNHRGIVEDGANVAVLDLIKGIDGFDTVIEELVEHEADASATGELVHREVVGVAVNGTPKFGSELGDDREDHAARALVAHDAPERLQLGTVLLQLCGNALFDIGKGCSDMMHKNLGIFSSLLPFRIDSGRERTMLSFRARNGVPQYCALPL